MHAKFWLERWRNNKTGFHQQRYNTWLLEYWPKLELRQGARVFVPLCGKSLDMRWLAEQGFDVRGIELSQVAVEAFFHEMGQAFEVEQRRNFKFYSGQSAAIFCGDFFDLTAGDLTGTQALFDRGALVALPADMRARYVDHMLRVVPDRTTLLVVTIEYDQNLVSGPPFAVHSEEVQRLFGARCEIERVDGASTDEVPPHFQAQGTERFSETVYRIVKID
ncbi:MAG: thiopurine S-methyltransferase [Gammaproteobacteria bacterium]|nr:thiopurine S-methyltransferase [Gammaproteobacteria bacterium]